ncbi:MAG: hypothetical protein WA738_03820 [Candidatus Angelobacter sp.]
MGTTIPDLHYVACWTEDDGIHSCGHEHPSVRDAMNCLVPDGGCFIRACGGDGVFRSLNEAEFIDFMEAVLNMPWRPLNKA